MPDPFADQDDLAAYLHRELPDNDPMATLALAAASEIVRTYTGQVLSEVTDDEAILDGRDRDILLLPELPATAVTEVVLDPDLSTEETLDTTDYRLGSAGMLYRVNGTWPAGGQNIKVSYDHGHEDIPGDIRLVTVAVAARLWDQANVSAESMGSYNATYEATGPGLTPGEKMVLDGYRHKRVA